MSSTAIAAINHAGVFDAVHRFTWGFDHNDADTFASSLAEDAVVDITPVGRRLGFEFPIYNGRREATDTMMSLVGPLDTSHTASNFRVFADDDHATMTCNVMAQRFRPGTGFQKDAPNYLMMNLWSGDLVRVGDLWQFRKLVVDCAWAQGDIGVILPEAA